MSNFPTCQQSPLVFRLNKITTTCFSNIQLYKTQNKIIVACCILHNYLMTEDPNQNLIDEVRHELTNERENNDDTTRGELVKADVTGSMWIAY